MGLFSSHQKAEQVTDPSLKAKITTIPTSFYGGKDPLVYAPKVEVPAPVTLSTKGQELQEKPVVAPPVVPPPTPVTGTPFVTANTSSELWVSRHKTALVVFLIILALGGTAALSWFMIFRTTPPTQSEEVVVVLPPQQTPSPFEEPPLTEVPVVVTSTAPTSTPEATSTPSLNELPLQFPRILLVDSSDTDADTLTDQEEEIFGTDPGIWDSDTDGYHDGQEVLNLYNPKGFAPVRLIDSGLVRDYVHPRTGYRIYYPVSWETGDVDPLGNQILFTAITGDYVEVRVNEKLATETFQDWFARRISGEQFSDLVQLKNRFGVTGYRRADDLVAYIPSDRFVFILVYHPGIETAIPYRHVMQMMTQSFRPQNTSLDVGAQPRIPDVPTSTVTGTL